MFSERIFKKINKRRKFMNKNKKIISASLALALGVSLLIPNAKANEEKSVENALKEPVKTSETAKIEEK